MAMSRKVRKNQNIVSDTLANISKKSVQKGKSLSAAASVFTAKKVSEKKGANSEPCNVIPQLQISTLDPPTSTNDSPTAFLESESSRKVSDSYESGAIEEGNVETILEPEKKLSIKEQILASLKKLPFFKLDTGIASQNAPGSSTCSEIEKDQTDEKDQNRLNTPTWNETNDAKVGDDDSLLPDSTVMEITSTVYSEDSNSLQNQEKDKYYRKLSLASKIHDSTNGNTLLVQPVQPESKSLHGLEQKVIQPENISNILNPKEVKTESRSLYILRPQDVSQQQASSVSGGVSADVVSSTEIRQDLPLSSKALLTAALRSTNFDKQTLRIEQEKLPFEQQQRQNKQDRFSQKIHLRKSGDLVHQRISLEINRPEFKDLKVGSHEMIVDRRNTEEDLKLPRAVGSYDATLLFSKLNKKNSSKKLLFPPNTNISYSGSSLLSDESEQSSQSQQTKTSHFLTAAQDVGKQLRARSLVERWGEMTQHGQFINDQDHLVYMRNAKRRSMIDLPDALIAGVRDEVFPILQDTLKQYKLELGNTHILTFEMQRRIQTLREEINNSSAKDV